MQKAFKRYFLPGFVFQSAVIAGGYGTGRELAEFFLPYGPLGGLLAMVLVTTVIYSAVCAATFEFARVFRSYDYRSFFKHLLGRIWPIYEVLYFLQMFLVLAVVAAAAGAILNELFELPQVVGVVGMMSAVGVLALRGTPAIERFLAGWSFVLYAVYLVFFGLCFARFGTSIVSNLSDIPVGSGWALGGVRYASYNLAIVPAITFCIRHIETRREAVGSGLLAGPIAIFPGVLFFLAMAGQYPQIQDVAVPSNFLLDLLGSRGFQLAFQLVLFGTLIETGVALVHGVNERMARLYEERKTTMPWTMRPAIAVTALGFGALLARVGIVDLIAAGYGTITWFFLAVYVIPILTVGVWMVRARETGR